MKIWKYAALLAVLCMLGCAPTEDVSCTPGLTKTVGLIEHSKDAYPGYTLFAPTLNKKTYLINNEGRLVHAWGNPSIADGGSTSVYLLPNGHLLRNALYPPLLAKVGKIFGNHGALRHIEAYTWDGDTVWQYAFSNERFQLHHDAIPLPNGNVLAIAWERLSQAEAIAQGRDPLLLSPEEGNELWAETILEIQPDYQSGSGGKIVWQWHLTDHLVQDKYPDKKNYLGPHGVKEHPERVDINYVSTGPWKNAKRSDWVHWNAIDYNPHTDQIMVSSREFSEFWIIDHKKGDLIYRYGNDRTYQQGTRDTQQLFYQHNAHWIKEGLPGEGHILVFNNGADRADGSNYSSVMELSPDMSSYGKAEIVWQYQAAPGDLFYSPIISGAQRLPNGNTLMDEGVHGHLVEVNAQKEKVWEYISPVVKGSILSQGEVVPTMTVFRIPNVSLNLLFRASRYAPTYPGLAGKDLTPKGFIEKNGCS